MKNSKIYLMVVLFAVSILSCQKEEAETINLQNSQKNVSLNEDAENQLRVFNEDGAEGQFYSDYFYNKKKSETETINDARLCSFPPGSNNLLLCTTTHQLPPFVNYHNTFWDLVENKKGSIDKTLEYMFNTSLDFSSNGWPRVGPPTQIVYAEVVFHESPDYNPTNGLFDIYHYLNSSIIPLSKADELRTHFACAIKDYRDMNMPGALISNVNFYGDILLCGSNVRYLKASFRLTYH